MTLDEITKKAINPAMALLPPKMDRNPQARVMLLAIGLQESGFVDRYQKENGPARGFWQFERGGGVTGVMNHAASREYAQAICAIRGVKFERAMVWSMLAVDDVLAAAFARLLLWTDAAALPERGDVEGAWRLYADKARTWSPGKPHRDRWDGNYKQAVDYVYGVK